MTALQDIGPVALRPRDVQFDWDGVPLHWMPGEPVATHVINALNLLLPAGERMFVSTFKEALAEVTDPEVREAMIGFMGQEAVHAETHDKVLWQFLDRRGIDPRPYVAQADFIFGAIGAAAKRLPAPARYRNLVERLAFIAGIEHFTAVLGDWILNADLESFGADPTMADLFRWHGAEEVEHRSVSFDVATHFGMGYVQRYVMFVLGSGGLLVTVVRGTKFLVHQDPTLPNYGYPRVLAEMTRAMSHGALPKWRSLAAASIRYLRPDYTPEVEGNTAQATAYLAKSPTAQAALA
ncbi:metal-dependent hydrolase [Jatrophihabitans sp.]|uniref:metal-dependent hydrolase n=1 Tax=Jatrophihabitans sp. TaxID=1932789 RepID=UPI0030C76B39|nr:metal-dependent hydrolase [Jatrophihabitans sp.]